MSIEQINKPVYKNSIQINIDIDGNWFTINLSEDNGPGDHFSGQHLALLKTYINEILFNKIVGI